MLRAPIIASKDSQCSGKKSPILLAKPSLIQAVSLPFWIGRVSKNGSTIAVPTALAVAMCMLLQTGCSTAPQKPNYSANKIPTKYKTINKTTLDLSSIDELESLLEATDMQPVENERFAILRYGDVWDRIRSNMKLDIQENNYRVQAQESWFASRQTYIDRLSARASRYLYFTVSEAQKRNIPVELALLPVIESSYDPAATSNAAAAGMWQFIPSTGKMYGLQQNFYYDGRRDVVASTNAAYDFLTSLYNRFGSWELALASYNAGPGRIQQAINRNAERGLPTDFWSLKLPTETMNYVPRFFAVANIVKNPDSFGVSFPKIANRPHFRSVNLNGIIDLNAAADMLGMSYQELYQLNPGYRRGQTTYDSPQRLLIPDALSERIDAKLRSMSSISGNDAGYVATSTASTSLNNALSLEAASALLGEPSATVMQTNPLSTSNATFVKPDLPTNAKALADLAANSKVPSLAKNTAVAPTSTAPIFSITKVAPTASTIPVPSTPSITSTITTPSANIKSPSLAEGLSAIKSASVVTPSSTTNVNVSVVASSTVVPATSASLESAMQPALQQQSSLSVTTDTAKVQVNNINKSINKIEDPFVGNVQLATLETQQSVLAEKGEDLQLSYEQPYQPKLAQQATKAVQNSRIKTSASTAPVSSKRGTRTVHIVKSGENLSKVAADYGVTLSDLVDWNQMDADAKLWVGSSLYIYGATKKPAPVAKPTKYVVKAGDTLTGIASTAGLSIQELAQFNNLTVTSNVLIGQVLSLISDGEQSSTTSKVTKIATVNYRLKKGDTLASIAKKQGISLNELAKLNEVPVNYKVRVGDDVLIPSKASSKGAAKIGADEPPKVATKPYKLRKGDTLQSVAKKYHISLNALAELNGVPADIKVRSGDTVLVPKTSGK